MLGQAPFQDRLRGRRLKGNRKGIPRARSRAQISFPSLWNACHACYAIASLPRACRCSFGSSLNPPQRGEGALDEALISDRPFDFWGGGGGGWYDRKGDFRKKCPAEWFQRKKILPRKYLAEKIPTLKKKISFMANNYFYSLSWRIIYYYFFSFYEFCKALLNINEVYYYY